MKGSARSASRTRIWCSRLVYSLKMVHKDGPSLYSGTRAGARGSHGAAPTSRLNMRRQETLEEHLILVALAREVEMAPHMVPAFCPHPLGGISLAQNAEEVLC